MKKRMNKKAISEMISYVILIAMAVGLSIGVFIWLKDLTNVSPKIDCKEGTSLRIDDVTCTPEDITITVKNNGNFNVTGFIMQTSEDINRIPTETLSLMPGFEVLPTGIDGYYQFKIPLKPGNDKEISFRKDEHLVNVIQLQPYVKDEKGKIVVCEQAVIKQDVSTCSGGLIPIDLLPSLVSYWSFDETDGGVASDSKDGNIGSIYGNTRLLMHFDEGSGTTTNDESSYNNDGVINSATWTSAGKSGNALSFDGVDDYVITTIALPTNFSAGAWFKTSSTSGGIKRILFRGTTQLPSNGETFLIDINDSGGIRAGIRNPGGGLWQLVSSSGPYNNGVFHYAIFTYNAATKNISLYIDGNIKGSLLFSGNVNDINSTFRIGSATPVTENFTGTIDEVAIYSKALSLSEIIEINNYGRAKFIERVPGKSGLGNALNFDGADDSVNVPDSLNLKLGKNQTIGAWVNVSAYPSVFTRFVGKGTLSDRNYGLWIDNNGDVLFQIYTSSSSTCDFYNNKGPGDPANIALNSGWRHIAGTYNGSVGKLYIDGNIVNSSVCSITPPTSIAPLTIGSQIDANFSGSIDEVMIFNQTLDETTIHNIYCAQGGSVGC